MIGRYFNDGSQSKIGYYLAADVTATTAQCLPDGSREVTVEVALSSDAPPDIATYPPYVAGGESTDPGTMRVHVLLYAPTGGRIEGIAIEGAEPGVTSQIHGGLRSWGRLSRSRPRRPHLCPTGSSQGPIEGPVMMRTTPLARLAVVAGEAPC